MEILKIKLNETQTLIAYCRSKTENIGPRASYLNYVDFKVGPNSADQFVDCSPDAVMALLAMLDRQPTTP